MNNDPDLARAWSRAYHAALTPTYLMMAASAGAFMVAISGMIMASQFSRRV